MNEICLVSTYESGFQSVGTAVAAAHFHNVGVTPELLDVSVSPAKSPQEFGQFDWIGFHVPMFHSLPAAFQIASGIRAAGLKSKCFFFGLYASLFKSEILEKYGDYVFDTDWEDRIALLVTNPDELFAVNGGAAELSKLDLPAYSFKRQDRYLPPKRELLPHVSAFAKLIDRGAELVTGNVEATRGCVHKCTHCPIPPVYDGKVTRIPVDVVLQDIDNLVAMGARNISFIDPDFLNAPKHSIEIVRRMTERYPFLTYDFTAKVSHFRKHQEHVETLAQYGLSYVLTAMEFNNDNTLEILEKKHNVEDLNWTVKFLRSLGVHVKPTFVFINPWTSVSEISELLDFIESNDLIECVDPIQYKIKLLLFKNSRLLDGARVPQVILGKSNDLYTEWTHENPAIEEIYQRSSLAVDEGVARGAGNDEIFAEVRSIVDEYLEVPSIKRGPLSILSISLGDVPKYNVPNFCCAEPTDEKMLELKGLL
jgi:hopanoid C-3 methylase